MKKKKKMRIVSLVLSVVMAVSFSLENMGLYSVFAAVSNPNINYESNNAYAGVHDPAILQVGNTYYMYSTGIIGDGIELRTSTDLVSWTYVSSFEEQHDDELKVSDVLSATSNGVSNLWAPDVIQVGSEYWMFYSCSAGGSRNSCIALAKATNPLGPFTYEGIVIKTTNSTASNMNAIDACIEYDQDGNMWMVYGSFFGGIRVVQLDKTTGFVKTSGDEGTLIASRPTEIDNGSLEGPIIRYHDGYYYLFVAYDNLFGPERNGGGSYHIRVGRSTTINGEYVDQDGISMKQAAETTGYKLTANYKFNNATGWWAVGHCDIFEDTNGKWIYASHARVNGNQNAPYSFIHQMTWNEEGWPLISPEPYVGETIGKMNASDAAGLYERIAFHDNKETLANTLTSVEMKLNSDYTATISGISGTGTWSFSGDNTVTVIIGDVKEVYTLMEGWDAENNVATVVLTGNDMSSGSTGLQRWGKRITQYAAPGYTVNVETNNTSYGTVSGGATVNSGENITVTAAEKSGYSFIHWLNEENEIVSTEKSYSFTPTNNITLTAMFSDETNPTITTAVNNSTYGSASGGATVSVGNVVTLTATPAGGSRFVAWKDSGGNVLSTNAVYSMRAYKSETLTAYFESLSTYYVADYLSDGSKFYDTLNGTGTVVATLMGNTSVNGEGVTVEGTSGDATPTNYVKMNNPFKDSTSDAVTLVSYMTINETADYDYKTLYTFYTDIGFLTITANGGIHLNDWAGNYFDNSDNVWTPDGTEHLYSMVVTKSSIKVYEDGTLINTYACGSNVLAFIKSCDYVSLGTGNDTYNAEYGGWAWGSASTSTSELVFLEAELNSTDIESMVAGGAPCTVTVSSNGNGTVIGTDEEINAGKTTTVTANANEGYRFAYWKDSIGNIVSTSAIYTFKVMENISLTAYFLPESSFVDITVNTEDDSKGSVTGGKTDVIVGTSVTITATPTQYYKFKGWQHAGSIVSTSATYTFEASADAEYIALFEIDVDKVATKTFIPNSDDRLWAYYPFTQNLTNKVNSSNATVVNVGGVAVEAIPQYNAYETYVVNGETRTSVNLQVGTYGFRFANDVPVGTSQYTISFWMKNNNVNSNDTAVLFMNNTDTNDTFTLGMNTSTYANNCFQTISVVDGNTTNKTSSVTANTGAWINVILTVDNSVGTLYINGSKAIDNINVGKIFTTANYNIYSGVTNNSSVQTFHTALDDLYIYDGVLTSSEIAILSNGGTYNNGDYATATITLTSSNESAGTLYGAGDVVIGTEATVIARPSDGYKFVQWEDESGNVLSSNEVYTFTPSANVTYVAVFEATTPVIPNTYTVTATSSPEEGGSVSGAGTFDEGTKVILTANVNSGYIFKKWTMDGADAGTETTLTIASLNANKEVVAVFEAETPAAVAKVKLVVSSPKLTVNGEKQGNTSYTEMFDVGTEITLTCDDTGFVRWQNQAPMTMCETKTYTFNIVTDTVLSAVTVADIENEAGVYSAFVEFVSEYGQVMNATTWFSNSTNKSLPAGPSKYGYVFTGWSYNGTDTLDTVDDVKALLDGTSNHIVLTPLYVAEGSTYTINVYYDDETTPVVYNKTSGTTFSIPSKTIAGKKFSHWSDERNGANKLSTNDSLYLKVSRDKTLYAVYVDESVAVVKEPTIVVMDMVAVNDSATNKVVIVANHDVPDGYTIQQHGIIRTTNATVGANEEDFVIGGTDVRQHVSSDLSSYGVYVYTINVGSSTDTVVYARGYLIVKNVATEEIITLYSPIVSGSYNSLQ